MPLRLISQWPRICGVFDCAPARRRTVQRVAPHAAISQVGRKPVPEARSPQPEKRSGVVPNEPEDVHHAHRLERIRQLKIQEMTKKREAEKPETPVEALPAWPDKLIERLGIYKREPPDPDLQAACSKAWAVYGHRLLAALKDYKREPPNPVLQAACSKAWARYGHRLEPICQGTTYEAIMEERIARSMCRWREQPTSYASQGGLAKQLIRMKDGLMNLECSGQGWSPRPGVSLGSQICSAGGDATKSCASESTAWKNTRGSVAGAGTRADGVGRIGQRWRVTPLQDVSSLIVRETETLCSRSVARVPPGRVVVQSAAVTALANGVLRMPIGYPRGWVTVHARSVSGPTFLVAIDDGL